MEEFAKGIRNSIFYPAYYEFPFHSSKSPRIRRQRFDDPLLSNP